MVILGLTGPIGHGKSTFADVLLKLEPSSLHFESFQVVAEVANAMHKALTQIPDPYNVNSLNEWLHFLPGILNDVTHVECPFKTIELQQEIIEQHPIEYQKFIMHVENLKRQPNMLHQAITAENKEMYRPFLQWLGGYLVQKVDAGIWYNELVRRIHAAGTAGAKLCVVGGLRFPSDAAILRANGAIIVLVSRPGHLQSDSLDPTERERQNIKPDCTVINNGTLADLQLFASKFLNDLANQKIDQTYHVVTQ